MSGAHQREAKRRGRQRKREEEKALGQFLTVLIGMRKGPLAKRIKMARLLICGYTSDRKPLRQRLWLWACNAAALLCFTAPFILLGLLIRRAMG
jgi:hypothetical protein